MGQRKPGKASDTDKFQMEPPGKIRKLNSSGALREKVGEKQVKQEQREPEVDVWAKLFRIIDHGKETE